MKAPPQPSDVEHANARGAAHAPDEPTLIASGRCQYRLLAHPLLALARGQRTANRDRSASSTALTDDGSPS